MLRLQNFEEYQKAYQYSIDQPEVFWEEQANSFRWFSKWKKVVEWDFHSAHTQWFTGGKTNITINCLDRHAENHPDKTALIWEPNNPSKNVRKFSYRELLEEVNRFSNGLRQLNVGKGDRVLIYMPMVPELTIAVLACARIGAVHSVVFAGFSATSLHDRLVDSSAKVIICADANDRGPKLIGVKDVVDEALSRGLEFVEHVIVFNNCNAPVTWSDRDHWWHDVVNGQTNECVPEVMDSEDLLFILYTSGSTGKPKGVVHTCGGYMVYVMYSFNLVFQPSANDIHWCTADIGWITGHSYIIYGPLLSGVTTVMFEGVPTYPDASRFWQVIEKHKINIFYTAPTAIRALMAAGDKYTEHADLSSLRVIGSVGEPINSEAWYWYHEKIGKGKIPLVDTWWQTETGGILISPLAGVTDQKPCYASYPLPGIQPILVDASGNEISDHGVEGLLCIKYPWPSIIRTTYGDHERCRTTYFAAFPGLYFTGDGARRDPDGRYRIIGRVDDVINVSGHRLGTGELENAINEHPNVVESAVVGFPHDIKGQAIFAYVIPRGEVTDQDIFFKEINIQLVKSIGGIAHADKLMVVSGLPKTRSGKIMRRIIRKVAEGDLSNLGDTTTLLNPEIVEEIISKYNSQ